MIETEGITVVSHYGLKLYFWHGNVVHVEHFIDKEELAAARVVFNPLDRIINAGNGIGATTTMLAGLIGTANIRAYEPNRDLCDMSAKNVVFEGEPIEVRWGALSTGTGDTRFFPRSDWWNSALDQSRQRDLLSRNVPCFEINEEIRSFGATALLLDIEGEEVNVIPHIDPKPVRAIVCELHREPYELRSIIEEEWGFTVSYWVEQFPDIFVIGAER